MKGEQKMAKITTLDCSACKSDQTMVATKVSKFSGIVQFIGYVFVVPSVLGVILCVMAMFNVAGHDTGDDAQAMAIGMLVVFAIISLVGGLIGWILIMKKRVFKCTACGHIIDRD